MIKMVARSIILRKIITKPVILSLKKIPTLRFWLVVPKVSTNGGSAFLTAKHFGRR